MGNVVLIHRILHRARDLLRLLSEEKSEAALKIQDDDFFTITHTLMLMPETISIAMATAVRPLLWDPTRLVRGKTWPGRLATVIAGVRLISFRYDSSRCYCGADHCGSQRWDNEEGYLTSGTS